MEPLDPRFLEAWCHCEHRVLGRRLHPLCLYDVFALALVESPLLHLSRDSRHEITPGDLRLAVAICSGQPGRFITQGQRAPGFLANLGWALGCQGRRMVHGRTFESECQAFAAYVADYWSPPVTAEGDGEGGQTREIKAPWLLSQALFVQRHTSESRHAVWTMPIGELSWTCAVIGEQLGRGNQEILSPDEVQFLQDTGQL